MCKEAAKNGATDVSYNQGVNIGFETERNETKNEPVAPVIKILVLMEGDMGSRGAPIETCLGFHIQRGQLD